VDDLYSLLHQLSAVTFTHQFQFLLLLQKKKKKNYEYTQKNKTDRNSWLPVPGIHLRKTSPGGYTNPYFKKKKKNLAENLAHVCSSKEYIPSAGGSVSGTKVIGFADHDDSGDLVSEPGLELSGVLWSLWGRVSAAGDSRAEPEWRRFTRVLGAATWVARSISRRSSRFRGRGTIRGLHNRGTRRGLPNWGTRRDLRDRETRRGPPNSAG
jgi:hypothetical protein